MRAAGRRAVHDTTSPIATGCALSQCAELLPGQHASQAVHTNEHPFLESVRPSANTANREDSIQSMTRSPYNGKDAEWEELAVALPVPLQTCVPQARSSPIARWQLKWSPCYQAPCKP